LYERSKTTEGKELQKQKIIENVLGAIDKNPNDTGLYKLIMLFASDKEKQQIVSVYLNKIVQKSMIVPRADIAFFVQQAVEVNSLDLAQQFINRAREWYHYSRVVLAAQEFLDKQKVKKSDE
jgi:hypothetical protein